MQKQQPGDPMITTLSAAEQTSGSFCLYPNRAVRLSHDSTLTRHQTLATPTYTSALFDTSSTNKSTWSSETVWIAKHFLSVRFPACLMCLKTSSEMFSLHKSIRSHCTTTFLHFLKCVWRFVRSLYHLAGAKNQLNTVIAHFSTKHVVWGIVRSVTVL